MLGKFSGCLIAFAVGVLCRAESLTVQFETKSPREIWIAAALPDGAPKESIKSDETSVAVPLESIEGKAKLFVWDKSSGMLAELQVPEKPASGGLLLKVGATNFTRLFHAKVRVEHKGLPVAAGLIDVQDSERKIPVFLAPADKGEISIYALRLGQIKVGVQVKVGEKTKSLPPQIFDLTKPTEPVPLMSVSVAEDVAVVEPPKASPAGSTADSKRGEADKTPSGESKSAVETIVIYVVALAIVGGGVWYFLRYAKQNPKAVEDSLKKLGVVNLPDPNADDGNVDAVAAIAKPQPVQPIILDPAATPDAISPAAGVSTTPGEPTLVGPSGERIELGEGTTMVGREQGLAISLGGESSVSRIHAEIVRQGESITVSDMQSTNGTYVNGRKIDAPTALRPGDLVQFGMVRFRVEA